MPRNANIIEVTQEGFERDVVERSMEVPVVLDFWAQWCAPCRMLGPVLEKLAREFDGQFVLAKADTERLPEIAAALGVRSIPAVFGLRNGRVVDSFIGALPEAAVRAWLEALLPTPSERLVAEAKALESSDAKSAEAKYRKAIELAPHEPLAKFGLAGLLFDRGRLAESQAIVTELEKRGFLEPEAEKLKAELTLRLQAKEAGGLEAARAAVAADPKNTGLQLKLAEALAAAGQYPEALDLCLALVEQDRKGVGEDARKTMLNIFQLLPEDSELVSEYRHKLALALY
jgi:putative thioredoxin